MLFAFFVILIYCIRNGWMNLRPDDPPPKLPPLPPRASRTSGRGVVLALYNLQCIRHRNAYIDGEPPSVPSDKVVALNNQSGDIFLPCAASFALFRRAAFT